MSAKGGLTVTENPKQFVPTDEELYRQVAASLRLEGFETTPERLRELERRGRNELVHGQPRQRRQTV